MKRLSLGALIAFTAFCGLQSQAGVNFEKEIWPIIQDRCVDCHRAPYEKNGRMKKPKAGLRMDGAKHLMYGSEDRAIIIPGDPDKSPMVKSISLPEDHDDIMPPKDGPLTKDQIALIKTWIKEGADFGGWKGAEDNLPEPRK